MTPAPDPRDEITVVETPPYVLDLKEHRFSDAEAEAIRLFIGKNPLAGLSSPRLHEVMAFDLFGWTFFYTWKPSASTLYLLAATKSSAKVCIPPSSRGVLAKLRDYGILFSVKEVIDWIKHLY